MSFHKITESDSNYDALEKRSVIALLNIINREDQTVAMAVQKVLPAVAKLTEKVVSQLKSGGRLFYMGAGTSGRLGVVDASECPPTFGVAPDKVIGLIAGGDAAIRKAVEFAEDNADQGWEDLKAHHICEKDFVVGLAASGTTPYVVGALSKCQSAGIPTGCICCNEGSPLAAVADFVVEVVVGPEVVTGSSRMKAGTAQKMILNMISTTTMIQLGHVQGHRMVDMQLSNHKLENRAQLMVMEALNIEAEKAKVLLQKHGSVRAAILAGKNE